MTAHLTREDALHAAAVRAGGAGLDAAFETLEAEMPDTTEDELVQAHLRGALYAAARVAGVTAQDATAALHRMITGEADRPGGHTRPNAAERAVWLREAARFLRGMLRALDAIPPAGPDDPDARLLAQSRRRDILESIALRFSDRVPGALIRPGATPARLSAFGVTVHCAAGVPQLYRDWAAKADAVAADIELQIVMQRGAA